MRARWLEALVLHFREAFSHDSRALTEAERRDAEAVFGPVLDLEPVRVMRASLFSGPMALGNVIRIPLEYFLDREILIHELAHVWQYQTRGTEYISNSVYHQLHGLFTTGSRRAAYHVTGEDLRAPSIHDLPAEKQAVIVQRWFADSSVRRNSHYQRFLAQVRSAKSS